MLVGRVSNAGHYTYGLGPCVDIVVGHKSKVSMLHAPMPDAGGLRTSLMTYAPLFRSMNVLQFARCLLEH